MLSRCEGDLQIFYYTRPVKLNPIQLELMYDFTHPSTFCATEYNSGEHFVSARYSIDETCSVS